MTAKLLHDEIIEALPPDFVRRMRNWAGSTRGGTVTTCSQLWGNIGSGSYEARLPILMGEAEDTHKAIRKLPQKYQEAVVIFWSYEQRTLTWMCAASPRMRLWMRAGPMPEWFKEWLDRGHALLQTELAKRAPERRTA